MPCIGSSVSDLGSRLSWAQGGSCTRCAVGAGGVQAGGGCSPPRPPAQGSPPHAYRVRGRFSQQPDPRQPRVWGTPPLPCRGRARSGPPFRGGVGPTACGRPSPPGARPGGAKPRGLPRRWVQAVPAICSGRAGCRGLRGSPAPRLARSTTSWSARQKRPSSRSANSSPGMSWRLQATQRKHSMWYTLARACITKSFLLKPMLHLAHLMPYNLSRAQPRKKEKGGKEGEHGKGEGKEVAGVGWGVCGGVV